MAAKVVRTKWLRKKAWRGDLSEYSTLRKDRAWERATTNDEQRHDRNEQRTSQGTSFLPLPPHTLHSPKGLPDTAWLPPVAHTPEERWGCNEPAVQSKHRTHRAYAILAEHHDAGIFVNRVVLDACCRWPPSGTALAAVRRADAHRFPGGEE